MAAVCLIMTAHADEIHDHSSFAHELNSSRWLKISLSENDAKYEEHFCEVLKDITAEENVQYSRPVKANGNGDPGTLFVLRGMVSLLFLGVNVEKLPFVSETRDGVRSV